MDVNHSKITDNSDDFQTSNQKIFSLSFTDGDGFNEFFVYRGLEIIQLNSGSFKGQFLSIQIGNLYFMCNQTNQGIQAFGRDLTEYRSFSIVLLENEGKFYSYRHAIDSQRTLFGFNGKGADLVVSRGGILAGIYIPLKVFHGYAEKLQRYDLDDRFLDNNHVNLSPHGMREIKDYLKQIFWLAEHKPTWLQKPHVIEIITDDFLPLLISNIPTKLNSKCFLKPSRRAKLIAQAEQHMLANLEKPLTLKQLAQKLESSSSALSYGFQDLFGMSPMRYLKVRRLNAMRKHLKAREPENCRIAILANQFGFYSPGHFTRDYKIMFGELPSETLQNTAKGIEE